MGGGGDKISKIGDGDKKKLFAPKDKMLAM